MTMSDDTKDPVSPLAPPPAVDNSATPDTREPWATPRVLAAEPFDRTHAGPDPDPMEGTIFYGPS